MLKSVLMRGLRGLIAVVAGFVVSYFTTNLGDIITILHIPLSLAGIVTSAVTAGLLMIDKWARAYGEK